MTLRSLSFVTAGHIPNRKFCAYTKTDICKNMGLQNLLFSYNIDKYKTTLIMLMHAEVIIRITSLAMNYLVNPKKSYKK